MKRLVRCLNPHGAGHDNPAGTLCCQRCDFLVEGAHIAAYEVISFIGAGSYGYVYKVRECAPLSRILALKVLRLDQFNDKVRASFFQEARRIANMQHANILPVYNFGQLTNEQPYLIMEYAPRTIKDLFHKADGSRRPAFAEELVPYVQQAAAALHYIHHAGLIHQDVKPGNLLIGRNGQLLLADFGTTLYLGVQTHASLGEVTGTASHMAPEQWQGTPRRESDQYALAICCYELLTDHLPFAYKQLTEMWNAHFYEQPPSPQQWNPRIPVEVAAVLLRAMAKEYKQRYRSILDFANAYEDAIKTAQQRYVCYNCGQQNRSGAQRCSNCGTSQDNRTCLYCDASVRFGQRCCSACGRLTIPPLVAEHSPLQGVSVGRGRYMINYVLKQTIESRVMTAVAIDTQQRTQKVFLKRWECADGSLAQRAHDIAYYERATAAFTQLHHPLLPTVIDRFAESKHYYMILNYIDGESIEAHLQKILHPLSESEVVRYIHSLLNVLSFLQQQRPPVYHYDISPTNIIIERTRNRPILTGFQIQPPPSLPTQNAHLAAARSRTTRKLVVSPYLPIQDKPYDQRTCIYALAATMHHALTNVPPPHYPAYPPVRVLNPTISPALESILSRALFEDTTLRYQTYAAMQRDVRALLSS
ncbi:MAG: protein kinase [Chloroflexi bacterium]|nr:protein kinase [Chloroflexota bacterium]